MFKIANDRHVDMRTYNAALPRGVVAVIDKALSKKPDERYQTGAQIAAAIRLCMENPSNAKMRSTDTHQHIAQ